MATSIIFKKDMEQSNEGSTIESTFPRVGYALNSYKELNKNEFNFLM